MLPPRSQVRRSPGQGPIIPEIAQAYMNDPRTRLAQQTVQNGIDTSPVAEGKYAWADALARVVGAGAGAYQDKRIREQYGKQDDATVQERADSAQRALAALDAERAAKLGTQAQPAVAPEQAAALAGAMGAPAPKTAAMPAAKPVGGGAAPTGPAGLPMAPPPVAPPASVRQPQPQRGVVLTDPLAGRATRVSSGFGTARPNGRRHSGLDYAAPEGTPVVAPAGGRVIRAWNDTANGGGNSVLIRHADGSTSGYAHLASFNVRPGDEIEAGKPIGAVGNTGRSTGPHLHFTYRDPSGRRVDPSTLQFGEPQQQAEQTGDQPAELEPVEVTGYSQANDYGIPQEEMPVAPQAVGPTQSRGLRAAYELAASGNPYESARAQTMITGGLDQQTDLDERAAGRQNDLNMTTYRAGLDRYAGDRTQLRSQRFERGERMGRQSYQTDERVATQEYNSSENEKQRGFQRSERLGSESFQARQAELNRLADRSNLELQVGSREDIARSRALSTPTGQKAIQTANEAVQSAANTISRIDRFLQINAEQNTGGIRERLPFGADTYGNRRLQEMEAIGNQLAIDLSTVLKGALSDRDMETIKNGGLSITRTRAANRNSGAFMRLAAERASDFQVAQVEALANGDRTFTRNWAAYRDAVPLAPNAPTFDQWKSTLTRYDAQGRPVQ